MLALSDQSVLLLSLGALAAAGLVLFVVGAILYRRERRMAKAGVPVEATAPVEVAPTVEATTPVEPAPVEPAAAPDQPDDSGTAGP
jgi:hypothetical protein